MVRLYPGSRHPVRSGACYNIPGNMRAPANRFALCALPMQSLDFKAGGVMPCYSCINNNCDLLPVLDGALERTAWIILVYRSIGRPKEYGWYDWGEFQKDVRSIAARDFRVAPMNDITLYAREMPPPCGSRHSGILGPSTSRSPCPAALILSSSISRRPFCPGGPRTGRACP